MDPPSYRILHSQKSFVVGGKNLGSAMTVGTGVPANSFTRPPSRLESSSWGLTLQLKSQLEDTFRELVTQPFRLLLDLVPIMLWVRLSGLHKLMSLTNICRV